MLTRLVESGQGRILARATDHTRELHYVVAPTSTLADPVKVEQLHDFLKRLAAALVEIGNS